MSAADGCLVVLWTAATLYAVLGGADFGAGFWDLLAGGEKTGRRPRALLDRALSPVWEANHVWLIFTIVVLWTAFPTAFSAIFTTLWIPLTLAALGVVVRGAGFAFRAASETLGVRRVYGALFGIASLLTPFFLGAALGGIASERVPPGDASGDLLTSWANPSGVVVGLLAVAACAFLAAVYMVTEARHAADPAMERYFRHRAMVAAAVTAALAVAGILVLREDAPYVGDRLTGEALPLVIAAAVLGVGTPVLLVRGHPAWSRLLAAGSVAAVAWAWAVAQWPYLLPTRLTVDDAAGDPQTLAWVLVIFVTAIVVVVPPLVLLFTLAQRGRLEEGTPP
ncbi:MAG TPA: cytochrome d ubiquinol oxidase subunit II [Miltoncostaeaceae bacterium]|nr:cytochrome d ubiquinol oxidase subunit II [Miltoncostaeaceae bacterium]